MACLWSPTGTGEAEDVVHPPAGGEEQVGLERHAVPVSAGHLQDGLTAVLLDEQAAAQGGVAHHRTLVVGDVQTDYDVLQEIDVVHQCLQIGAFGWSHLTCDNKSAGVQSFSQPRRHVSLLPQAILVARGRGIT
jgi:hypothetical protein